MSIFCSIFSLSFSLPLQPLQVVSVAGGTVLLKQFFSWLLQAKDDVSQSSSPT